MPRKKISFVITHIPIKIKRIFLNVLTEDLSNNLLQAVKWRESICFSDFPANGARFENKASIEKANGKITRHINAIIALCHELWFFELVQIK